MGGEVGWLEKQETKRNKVPSQNALLVSKVVIPVSEMHQK